MSEDLIKRLRHKNGKPSSIWADEEAAADLLEAQAREIAVAKEAYIGCKGLLEASQKEIAKLEEQYSIYYNGWKETFSNLNDAHKQLAAAQKEIEELKDLVKEQRLSIVALNSCIGGEGSLTTDNLIIVGRVEEQLAAAQKENGELKERLNELAGDWQVRTLQLTAAQKEIVGLKRGAQTLDDVWQKQLAAAQAREVKLREALKELHAACPWTLECDNFNHEKKDYHEYKDACMPLSRYESALTKAEAALAQHTNTEALDEAIRRGKVEVLRVIAEYEGKHIDDLIDWAQDKIAELESEGKK